MNKSIFEDTLDHVGRIGRTNCAQEVCDTLLGITGRFGLDRMIIGSQANPHAEPRYEREHILLRGWPEPWVERYILRDYARISPVVHYVKTHMRPFDWREAAAAAGEGHPGQVVLHEIAEFGIRMGISIPLITGDGALALLSLGGEDMDLSPEDFGMVTLVSTYAIERAMQLVVADDASRPIRLTRREAECMRWAAAGKSEWEISRILGISEHTSEKHLLSAKMKLGAANRTHAVAEAIRQGYIT
ncbi:LuxR family transcriptional regulator [Zhengella mangrovi]|uniref:LuxR family transcriptional regulator n=1 Tax=Zhengella mangrovi TaxID=1982044 RepID=A0A2G1QJ57_9HYPH|nr:LuxR family transcriptional regulator [Zhengella mangrovi]PHP65484.1 LuxR family transcriptional regulator [Zhengella mangrovi]